MITDKLLEVLRQDGVVAIATLGPDGPHMVNTWNSYINISADGRLLIPAGYMHRTEANIAFNKNVLITLGSSKVKGNHGPGAGFFDQGNCCLYCIGTRLRFHEVKIRMASGYIGRYHRFCYPDLVTTATGSSPGSLILHFENKVWQDVMT